MFHNFLTKENRRYFNPEDPKNNMNNIPKKDIMPNYSNIYEEIKKRTNDLRKYYNVNTVFKEMNSKENSLIYRDIKRLWGQYFFGPRGLVTEKYKFLKDYYDAKNLKIGLDDKIYIGTLDYYYLISNKSSYMQKVNSAKQKMLSLSNHLAFGQSRFDEINTNTFNIYKYLNNKKKNFIHLNRKSVRPKDNINNILKNNNDSSYIKSEKDNNNKTKNATFKKDNSSNRIKITTNNFKKDNRSNTIKIKKFKEKQFYNTASSLKNIFKNSNDSTNKTDNKNNNEKSNDKKSNNYVYKNKFKKSKIFALKELNEKKIEFNNDKSISLNNSNQINLSPTNNSLTSITARSKFFIGSISPSDNNMKALDRKLKKIKSQYNIKKSSPFFPNMTVKKNKTIQTYSDYLLHSIKTTLFEKITPIIRMNKTSKKKLSFIRYHLKSKNDKKIIKIITKRPIISILKDINKKEDKNLNN